MLELCIGTGGVKKKCYHKNPNLPTDNKLIHTNQSIHGIPNNETKNTLGKTKNTTATPKT